MQGGSNNHKAEELMKQPDYTDKIKHLLGNLQGQSVPGPAGGKVVVHGGCCFSEVSHIHLPGVIKCESYTSSSQV